MPPGASAASPISVTSMAMLAVAGSSIPATGSSSQGTTTPATSSMGGANPPGISTGGPAVAGSTIVDNATAGAATDPGPPGATGQQLTSAIGGSTDLTANPGAASVLLTPTPLSLTPPLPPAQASRILSGTLDAATIGGYHDSGALPENLPEPGALALFAIVLFASASRIVLRRLYGLKAKGSVASALVYSAATSSNQTSPGP